MNVLICFSHEWKRGIAYGAQVHVAGLIQGLAQRGHRTVLVAARGNSREAASSADASLMPDYELPFQSGNPLRALQAQRQLAEIAAKHRIDLVHAHHRTAGYHAEVLFRRRKIPYVITVHDLWRGAPLKKLHGRFLRRAIAVSDYAREGLIREFGFPGAAVRRIYNGVDLSRFHGSDPARAERFRERWGIRGTLVIAMVSRITKAKGQFDLVQALASLPADVPRYKCLIVGEGKQRKELERLAARLRIAGKVIFCGYQQDAPAVMQASDLVVLPSHRESFGLTIVEAMLSGKAVIGSDVGGIPEIIAPGKNGLLFPARDVPALAEALRQLLSDVSLRERLAGEGYRTARDRFSLSKMLDETEAYYAEILSS